MLIVQYNVSGYIRILDMNIYTTIENIFVQSWLEIIETSARNSVVPVATSNVKLFLKNI